MFKMKKINTMKKYLLLIILISSQLSLFAQGTNNYVKSINDWHKKRENDLKQPNGWLNLEGLFWLNKGVNTFGKAEGNDSRYQHNEFPAYLGDFIYEGDSVVWVNKNNNTVKINNIETKGTTPVVVFNKEGKAKVMDWSHFRWSVIIREDKVGIRLRNLEAAALKEFKGIDVIDEGGPNLFIVFGDETAGKTTYGAGRFIDIPKPDGSGNTEIDFNKAYNPPCAFTAFATCPLPPPQNRLKVSITAGEKNYGHH